MRNKDITNLLTKFFLRLETVTGKSVIELMENTNPMIDEGSLNFINPIGKVFKVRSDEKFVLEDLSNVRDTVDRMIDRLNYE